MSAVKIEFFHDVICSFCFPMSYRMRQLKAVMPEVEVIHRSFALVKEPSDFDRMFGSRENAKNEILSHWFYANQNDDLHRFNIDGMKQAVFPFPSSMNTLIAAKAAYFISGDDLYWDLFDALQESLFMHNKNVEDIEVIEATVQTIGIDLTSWRQHFADEKTREAVLADLKLAEDYQITSIPTLIVDGKHTISGAQPLTAIQSVLNEISLQKKLSAVETEASCKFRDGKFECD
ncbi:DsbA family oxidoreductase [Listeria booriae]|uniref:DsbA family oxidoreductase n=1 Tax=Listeria booriae TaxID=1552123 RepID=UPI0016280035|nr:DsbA family protein [Listeria booriae]MBC2324574.1 DsbA family protein [Listeria booriae]